MHFQKEALNYFMQSKSYNDQQNPQHPHLSQRAGHDHYRWAAICNFFFYTTEVLDVSIIAACVLSHVKKSLGAD